MALAARQIKVYLRLVAIGAVGLIVLLVVLMNYQHRATIWFFGKYEDINVLWLIAVTAVASILGWVIVRKVFSVIRDLKELRKARQHERQISEQQRLADETAEREKRIDEKLRRSITEEP
jgi:hypothetical protein